MNLISKISIFCVMIAGWAATADAAPLQYKYGKTSLRLSGYGTVGLIEPDFEEPLFIGDWRVRAQANYDVKEGQTFGVVYALDAQTVDTDDYVDELFALWQSRRFGRVEIGITDSIAGKLALGLPDVGGLRINDNPIFYKKIRPHGTIITDAAVDTDATALRVNLATAQIHGVQYGLSVAGLTDEYDFTIDAGLKIRRPSGKVKTAYSLGASFMNRPDNFAPDSYSVHVTADWRAQFAAAMNLQYNSWVWGLNGRVIYDQNPVSPRSDGLVVGTGVSYDLMKYSLSLTYMFSDTGIWDGDTDDYTDHSVVASFRYKYSQNVDGWISIGMTTETPFLSAGMRLTF